MASDCLSLDQACLDVLPDAVIALDAHQVIVAVNQAASVLTGYPVEAMLGISCAALLAPRENDGSPCWPAGWHPSAHLRSVRAVPEQDMTLRRADGADRRVAVTGAYRRRGDRLIGAVFALRDAGLRVHQMNTGIEIVSTVSHELRSPLTSVKGFTALLLNRWDRLADDDKVRMLEQVNRDADRVTRLITELLDISRLESGRLVLRRQMVDLARLGASVVDDLSVEYPALDVTLCFPSSFPKVYADPDKVVQVVTNLVENACKYASPTGLLVTGEANSEEVALSVTDRGDGIGAEDIENVFTRFFRRSEARPSGSGLGLWISRGLVEAHGGRLSVTSVPGQGSTFRFTLPRVDFDDTDLGDTDLYGS
ncbi:MAG: PAS domain-containing sensor histidine kinase [Acidimicrobiales bacterium]|nr:MAG: PAS domain-containing sensor histidine kinase [Acidimicrobiales bacterium]